MSSAKRGTSAALAAFGRFVVPAVALAVGAGVVLRFVTTSDLWLDEALSVNISRLGPADLLEALRHDGHPPAYYLVLHFWIELFGEGDVAVRSLSGVFALATLPVAFVVGCRRGGRDVGVAVLALTAIAPFCVRYATEARMYSMVTFLVFVALLLADDLWRRPSRMRWGALAGVTGVGLLTHYWVAFLGAAAVAILAWEWWRNGRRDEAVRIGSALAAGTVLFLPWVPSFLEQMAHTGTPWATAGRPTRDLVDLMYGFGGGDHGEGVLFGAMVVALVVLAALAWRDDAGRIVIGDRLRGESGVDVALAALTFGIGLGIGLVTDAAFAARYGAVVLPMVLLAAGRALTLLPSPKTTALAAAALVVAAAPGMALSVTSERTQGGTNAAIINDLADSGDVVAFCADQLGPSTVRDLRDDVVAVGLPTLESADLVDWVDYEDRNRAAVPADVAESLLTLAGDRRIFLASFDAYRTYEGFCPAVRAELGEARGPATTLSEADPDVYEPSSLVEFGSG